MDWVESFYRFQNEWFGVYLGEVEPRHYQLAARLKRLAGMETQRLLELGAGGGQTAIALAEVGYQVTTIELLPESVQHSQQLTQQHQLPIRNLQGDFYQIDLEETFEVLCYFDSFGIGTDADQRRLLARMANWLVPAGKAVVEVGTPWYWKDPEVRGRQLDLGGCFRAYEFDEAGSRLLDRWWAKEAPEQVEQQSLRCYTPKELEQLLQGTSLQLIGIESGGKVDYDAMEFIETAPLEEAMTYFAVLERIS